MIRKLIIVVLTLAAVGTSALWMMSGLNWACDWTYDGTVRSYRYTVGHFCSPAEGWAQHGPERFFYEWDTKFVLSLFQASAVIQVRGREIPLGVTPPPDRWIRLIGFELARSRWTESTEWTESTGRYSAPKVVKQGVYFVVRVPLWVPLALFATYPTIAFIRGPVRRWLRRRRGKCVKCGYNLTGNVSGTCPECGTRIGKR